MTPCGETRRAHTRPARARWQRATTRRGAVLLEAIVALVILAVAGTAVVTLAAESARAMDRAQEAAQAMGRADAFFHAVALWPREDLDRHLGTHPQGPWLLRIDRPTPTLYEAVLLDSAGGRALLRTTLYRQEAPDATP